jgi:hypothetical protein
VASNFLAGDVVASAARLEQMGSKSELADAIEELATLRGYMKQLQSELKEWTGDHRGPTPRLGTVA